MVLSEWPTALGLMGRRAENYHPALACIPPRPGHLTPIFLALWPDLFCMVSALFTVAPGEADVSGTSGRDGGTRRSCWSALPATPLSPFYRAGSWRSGR